VRRTQIWVRVGFRSLVVELRVIFKNSNFPKKWHGEIWGDTETGLEFLHGPTAVYALAAYGKMPCTWVQEESYVTVYGLRRFQAETAIADGAQA